MVIVDGANVVGSVPDGWWRDRLGAAARLLEALADLPSTGLPDLPGPVEVTLVVEGAARPLAEQAWPEGVRVLAAPTSGSGDDAIVDLVASRPPGQRCVVVTADRELRERVLELGAQVVGPRAVPYPS